MLYLDYAASTPIGEEALKTLITSLENDFANPSSAHKLGRDLNKKINKAREDFLKFIDAPKDGSYSKFIFTSSATESNNIIINGLKVDKGEEILHTRADHPSVVNPISNKSQLGIITTEYSLNSFGEIIEDELLKKVDSDRVKLLVISSVNNQSGTIQSVLELSKKIKNINPDLHIHIDASQSFGKFSFSIKDSGVDSLSISAHKIYGPKSMAGLYIKDIKKIKSSLWGGGQEYSLRSGTVSTPLILSFHAAVFKDSISYIDKLDNIKKINIKIREGLKLISNNILFPFPLESTSPYILTFIVPKISSDILLRHLEDKEVYLSSTSACSSRIKGEQPVFSALNIDKKYHKNVLRLSLSYKNTIEDGVYFLKIFQEVFDDIKFFFR